MKTMFDLSPWIELVPAQAESIDSMKKNLKPFSQPKDRFEKV